MTSQTTFGSCCISGHLHEGSPTGAVQKLHGLDVYVTGDVANKSQTIVYITDVFGFQLNNARLLADELAANGFYVLVPDFFGGDSLDGALILKIAPRASLPERSALQQGLDTTAYMAFLEPWLLRHREAVSKPLIESFVTELHKDPAIKSLGATGYCWGGRYSVLLAHGLVDAAVCCHPSFLAVPGDLEGITKPVSIAVGDKDSLFSEADQAVTKQFFSEKLKPKGVDTEFVEYPNEVHGFAVRGDINVNSEKAAKEKATKQTVEFFKKHLV